MNIVGKLFSNVKGFYNEINPATLTGAIDVVVIRQSDGTYTSSPWHVRFGKMGVICASQKVVSDLSLVWFCLAMHWPYLYWWPGSASEASVMKH